jgi:hypothetical protein
LANSILRASVLAGLERVASRARSGRPKVSPKIENAIRNHLRAGMGTEGGGAGRYGSSTVRLVKRETCAGGRLSTEVSFIGVINRPAL